MESYWRTNLTCGTNKYLICFRKSFHPKLESDNFKIALKNGRALIVQYKFRLLAALKMKQVATGIRPLPLINFDLPWLFHTTSRKELL